MAGEIFIADKATLDAVKSVVDSTKTNVDSANSKLTDVQSKVTGIKSAMSVSELNKMVVASQSTTSVTLVLNLSTPGTLYYVMGASTDARMRVTVDGSIIYYRTLPGTNLRAGVIYDPSGLIENTIRSTPSGSFQIAGISSLPPNSTLSSSGNLIIPKPLKFNTLSVYIDSTQTSIVDYMYILD